MWGWWLARVERPVDSRPWALLRILVSGAIVGDLLRVAWLRLVPVLFGGDFGAQPDDAFVLDAVFGEGAGLVAYGVALGCLSLSALGVATRANIVLGVLAYAQLGHCFPPGDRAIDRVLRSVLLLLLVTNAHRRWALGPWLRKKAPALTTMGWAEDLLRLFLVVVYLSAGLAKLLQQPRWLATEGTPVLYRVMTDPMAAHLDAAWWWDHPAMFRVGGWATIALELGAVLLLTRAGPIWALGGVAMHLGIALTMELGMFSWGMLAVYPVLLWPLVGPLVGPLVVRVTRGGSSA